MRLRLVANVRREQSKLDGLLANVCERSRTLAFIERELTEVIRMGNSMPIFIQRVLATIFPLTFMKISLATGATASRTLMALIYFAK